MKNDNKESVFTTKALAFCAISAALCTAIMLTGGLVPVFTYCSPLIASAFLIPAIEVYGSMPALMVWAVSSALVLLIGADKEAAFFFLFFGWYPVLKPKLDKLTPAFLKTASKLIIFSALSAAMYYLTCFILGIEEIVSSFSASVYLNIAFLAAIVLCCMLFDRALPGLTAMFRKRFKKYIK